MSQDIEKQINQLNYKLRSLSEEQSQNQHAIQKQEQTEADFYEWKGQSYRLFDRILETWHNDRELGQFFHNLRQDAQQVERKLTHELEDQKETLLNEKRSLSNLENDLYHQRQKLAQEVKS
ncbi:hypothetical protein BACCIP111899_01162 [Bacillus rhizoplanae]|uniref:DUF3958 domain-containing protein n=1 Tax=Bacillus rhizoplanae TaxID=2880966 RepID=A0ABN7ZYC9_9BACI|nr:DUF3958 family protein [Bacillus rhizoplanae]CAG9611990.1 hypothetical protein BACCIP111899_01162 [Bacillus rhizoplanae]